MCVCGGGGGGGNVRSGDRRISRRRKEAKKGIHLFLDSSGLGVAARNATNGKITLNTLAKRCLAKRCLDADLFRS